MYVGLKKIREIEMFRYNIKKKKFCASINFDIQMKEDIYIALDLVNDEN